MDSENMLGRKPKASVCDMAAEREESGVGTTVNSRGQVLGQDSEE